MERTDIQSEEDVRHLVDQFYLMVLADPLIGFIFTDVVQLSWEHHMPTMYSFWSSILLDTTSYKGNPMVKHIALNEKTPLVKEHFDRWLSLWEGTVNSLYRGERAELAISRAKSIALLMQHKIEKAGI